MGKGESGLQLLKKTGNRLAKLIHPETILRYLGMPFQRLFDKKGDTHRFLISQGVVILENDGFTDLSKFLRAHIDTIIDGCYWADSLWKNATHHFNPKTKKGLWIWPGAQDQCKNWFRDAQKAFFARDPEKTLFFLGASLHTVQDVCQPYHSNCICLDGHQKYEMWADKHKEAFSVSSGGIYDLSAKPEGWVMENAAFSKPFLQSVQLNGHKDLESENGTELSDATRILLGRAQKTTAGFFVFFLEEVREEVQKEMSGPKVISQFPFNVEDLLCRKKQN